MGDTDRQYNGQLIEEYQRLMRIKKLAKKDKANKTIKGIDEELIYLRIKLQPLELPNIDSDDEDEE